MGSITCSLTGLLWYGRYDPHQKALLLNPRVPKASGLPGDKCGCVLSNYQIKLKIQKRLHQCLRGRSNAEVF